MSWVATTFSSIHPVSPLAVCTRTKRRPCSSTCSLSPFSTVAVRFDTAATLSRKNVCLAVTYTYCAAGFGRSREHPPSPVAMHADRTAKTANSETRRRSPNCRNEEKITEKLPSTDAPHHPYYWR